jgi:hypothetical protein
MLDTNHCHDNLWIRSTTVLESTEMLLKIRSFLVFHMAQTKESQIIEKPFLRFLLVPQPTNKAYDNDKDGGRTKTTPSHRVRAYQTSAVYRQWRNKWLTDSTFKSQKTHLDSSTVKTFLLLRFSLVGILFNNNCQDKALTFEGTPLFQINLKAKESKLDLGVPMLNVRSRKRQLPTCLLNL